MSDKAIAKKTRDCQKLLSEARKIQEEYAGEEMPTHVGAEFKRKTEEAAKLQAEIDEYERQEELDKLESKQHRLNELPGVMPVPGNGKGASDEVVGYLSLGQAFIESSEFQSYVNSGMPRNGSASMVKAATWHGRSSFIPLNAKAARERREQIEQKAIPTLSTADGTTFAVIQPQRLTEVVQSFEFERLTVRDLVNNSSTTSNAVEFPRMTSAKPEIATSVSDALTGGSTKPESTMAFDIATAPVRTLAVWMPVTEQQLEDFPQIRDAIDNFLRFDIKRLEEYQMVWGDGTGTDLLGIMETPNVAAFSRTPDMGAGTTVTLLDKIRGAMTDIQVNSLQPNGVLIHPIDFETLVLQKGSDDHYLRQIFPTEDGGNRVFSMRIVVSLAAENYRSGLSTDQRVVIVGDFRRGATVWDRHQLSVEVGLIDKQFIQNTRTLRAEERLAFAVQRPLAFEYIETVAAGT